MCNCHSYNADDTDSGKNPEVVLSVPERFSWERKTVCVDACIAHVIQTLWNNDIITMNSCCGHGNRAPSIILDDRKDKDFGDYVRTIIAHVDNRDFELLSYNLVNI
jgi:hypothetical protein